MENKKILVVDDNIEIIEIITVLLNSEGYTVVYATNGDEAIHKLTPDIDLVILDIMMPYKDGFMTCEEMRKISTVPILFLTAKTKETDKERGFLVGADDYLSKPFSYIELVSRVKALIRRYCTYKGKMEDEDKDTITIDDIVIDNKLNTVYKNDKNLFLTDIEYKIVYMLASNRKKVLSAPFLYEKVWKESYMYTSNNTIMVHIRKIRKKMEEDPNHPKYIKTVWGKGYVIE